jgi:DNA-binding transcriptional MerR regulator
MSTDNVGPDKVARREFGRTGDWLRRLERRGVIPPAPRDFSGYRVYPPEHLARIREILARRGKGDDAA